MRNLKNPTGRLERWALELQQWDFEVVHRQGKHFDLPDALSRMYEDEEIRVASFTKITNLNYLTLLEKVVELPKLANRRWNALRIRQYNFGPNKK